MAEHTAENDAGCYICQPDNPKAAEEGCAQCDRDFGRAVIEWEEHKADCDRRGICWASGLTIKRCQAGPCDCFRDLYPDDPYGVHPEAFVVGRALPPGADQ